MQIPQQGIDHDAVFETLESYSHSDLDTQERAWSGTFADGRGLDSLCKRAYTQFLGKNALYPNTYPSVLRLENEIVAMATHHVHAPGTAVGNFTSGGTESIMLAVKTAREHFHGQKPDGGIPQMILPETGHAAFHKAAWYLGLEIVQVPVDPQTFKADPATIREAMGPRTALLVGSAPSYPHGVVDPIAELGALAQEHEVLLHVDACMGGFLLPYLRQLGDAVPDFDFGVPGVSSISMDLHKYAFAAKGASIILYRDKSLRRHQIFTCAQWPGYSVINPTVQSTKSAGPLAAAWAVLRHVGHDGYLDMARRMREGRQRLLEGIRAIDDLHVLGDPEMTLVAFASEQVPIFRLADELNTRGWNVQEQLSYGSSPANIHLNVTPSNAAHVDRFLEDVQRCSAELRRAGPSELAATARNKLEGLSPADITPEVLGELLSMAGIDGFSIPERMADINELLDALPASLREQLLGDFVNELFVPPQPD